MNAASYLPPKEVRPTMPSWGACAAAFSNRAVGEKYKLRRTVCEAVSWPD